MSIDKKEEEKLLDFDLKIDPDELTDSIKKGSESGVKQGMKKGATKVMKDQAAKIAEETMKNIVNGGSPVKQTIEELTDIARMEALQNAVENMKNRKNQQQQQPQQQQSNPQKELLNTMLLLNQLGFSTEEIKEQVGIGNLMSMVNPNLRGMMPMLMNNKKEGNGDGNSMTQMMGMIMQQMMMQQNKPQQQPISQSDNGMAQVLTTLMTMQQQQAKEAIALQKENQQSQMQLMYNQLQQMTPQQVNPLEELDSLMAKVEKLKALGGSGNNRSMTDTEAQLEFQRQKMALDLERDKLKMQHQMSMDERKFAVDKESKEFNRQLLGSIQNFASNLRQQRLSEREDYYAKRLENDNPTQEPARSNAPNPPQDNTPKTKKISSRISNLLRVQEAD